jgi:transcriptional regulator with GAF, ATPase, and Fis domain
MARERFPGAGAEPGDDGGATSTPDPASREIRTLKSILEVCNQFNASQDFTDLLNKIIDAAISVFGARRGFLLLDTGQLLEAIVSRNYLEEDEGDLKISRTLAGKVFTSGVGVWSGNAQADPEFLGARSIRDLGIRSVLCAPLRSAGKIVGAVYLDNHVEEDAFTAGDLEFLGAFSDLAGIAVEDARLQGMLAQTEQELRRRNAHLEEEMHTRILELESVREQLRIRERELRGRDVYGDIVAQSEAMHGVFDVLDRVSGSALPVVIHGETGTGKELVARAIHHNGPRGAGPFVGLNCAAIPETLLESELFGYVKGAFSGANQDSDGLFVQASGGTLFLDEIGDMDTNLQAKLLRALELGEVRPVGGKAPVAVDVRIICATNKDLPSLVAEGSFREDLLYRLNVLQVVLPALRDRKEDIPLLAAHFLKVYLKREEKDPQSLGFTASALEALVGRAWPGNVRELRNTVERAALFAETDRISTEELERQFPSGEEEAVARFAGDFKTSRARFEKAYLEEMLTRHRGNVTKAAEEAQVQRVYFHRLIKKYGISTAQYK